MQYGIPTLIEFDTLEQSAALCRELGFSFVELNMNIPACTVERIEQTEKLEALKQKYGVYFTVHLDENLNVCDFNKEVAAAYMETVRRTIIAARKLGVPVLNMHMNHGVHFTLPDRKVELFEKYNAQYMDSWRSFRTMCEETIGDAFLKICIENSDGFKDYEREAIDFLLESKVFGLTWDIGHSRCASADDESFIRERSLRLTHFHIHDEREGKDHLTLGSGDTDLDERLLIAKKLSCRCVVETKTAESLKKSLIWLIENHWI